MLWYAHDNESGRVWIIGADSEADAAARADISVWMIRPLGDSFKGVITFNPEQWESDTVSPALETEAGWSPAQSATREQGWAVCDDCNKAGRLTCEHV